MLCKVCNRRKSNGHPLRADAEILKWVEQYGRGKVPWQKLHEEWGLKRFELPYVEQYRVGDFEQVPLFSCGAVEAR